MGDIGVKALATSAIVVILASAQYAISERVKVAFFVAIAYTDNEMTSDHLAKAQKAADIASRRYNVDVRPVVVDARRKDSASRLKPPADLRDELHHRAAECVRTAPTKPLKGSYQMSPDRVTRSAAGRASA
jgi:hypothetical protein